MPILACVAISIIIYALLVYSMNQSKDIDLMKVDLFNEEESLSIKCENCNKSFKKTFRYCPFCGSIREIG
ncbi:hypothetical protein [Alkaliphilus peptidifermentans]|uniref:Zinc-ribbon domain-containing protein n=1 Tax=Alkaliphilus peptidifermentans DSM 18978 TaxID=1120976 RepID=A0A1G5DQH4_9FIRM|nr:hypothetical protein [Alkaliphilus peptidifermentans]SCY16945.1 hypothetical protein SAMN03080606_00981 [Alkaliphilus peptidifermentans DSM 18978]